MKLELDRCDKPERKAEVLWIETVKGNERQKFIVYSPSIFGVYQHWTGKRTVPCFKNRDHCPGGHKEGNRKWRAYVHAWSFKRSEPVFIQLTDEAVNKWYRQISKGLTLRGQIIYVIRSEKDNGRLHVEVDPNVHPDPKRLPPEVDPLPSLWRMWAIEPSTMQLNSSLVSGPDDIPDLALLGGVG